MNSTIVLEGDVIIFKKNKSYYKGYKDCSGGFYIKPKPADFVPFGFLSWEITIEIMTQRGYRAIIFRFTDPHIDIIKYCKENKL